MGPRVMALWCAVAILAVLAKTPLFEAHQKWFRTTTSSRSKTPPRGQGSRMPLPIATKSPMT